jgi:hypothetical protein
VYLTASEFGIGSGQDAQDVAIESRGDDLKWAAEIHAHIIATAETLVSTCKLLFPMDGAPLRRTR